HGAAGNEMHAVRIRSGAGYEAPVGDRARGAENVNTVQAASDGGDGAEIVDATASRENNAVGTGGYAAPVDDAPRAALQPDAHGPRADPAAVPDAPTGREFDAVAGRARHG